MNKIFRDFSLIALFLLCIVSTTFAQEQTGEIQGTISDPQGSVIPNASISVVGSTIGYRRTVTSDANGYFMIRQVPPGNYKLTVASVSGFAEQSRDIQVVLGTATTSNFSMNVASATAVVTVSDDLGAPVDTADSKVQTSVSAMKIELLPKGNDFTSVIKTAPGARGESKSGGFTVDGASGSENVFIIDGQEVTNFRTGTLNGVNALPTGIVQEVQIKSSGFEAEFGGATGGVVNVVTKGGGNTFHGTFGAQFQTPKLNGAARPSQLRFTSGSGAAYTQTIEYFTAPKAQGSDFLPTATISGPIVKDRVWGFANYSPQIFTSDVTTEFYNNAPAATRVVTRPSENYRASTKYEYSFGRIDAAPTDNLRLSATYLYNPQLNRGVIPFGTASFGGSPASVNFGGSIGTLSGADLYSKQGGRVNSNNLTAQANWTPTSNLSITGRFSRGFLNEKGSSYFVPSGTRYICFAGDPTNPDACPQGLTDPANSNTLFDVSVRTNYEGDATYFFDAGALGRHELKGGYQRFRVRNDVDSGYVTPGRIDTWYDGTTLGDLGSPSVDTAGAIGVGRLIRFGALGRGENTNQSIYIQDKFQVAKRLTLNFGVRFEKEDLPSFNSFAPPINFGWGDKIAPRLGFSLDLFGDGSTKVFGSYGRFLDRLKFELPRGSFGGNFYRIDFFEIFPNSGPTRTAFTPASILGNFNDAPGGACPTTGFIGSGLSRCQFDYRIASNDPNGTLFDGKVDPNMKPFSQDEFTFGFERQLTSNYVFRSRFTHKNVINAIEDAGIRNNQGSEAYIIGNPGSGLHLEVLNQLGYTKSATPQRVYDGLEFAVERRLANNYYFNVNYTYSRLFGNYSGLASSDENGRTSPGVNRFFDLPFLGFTATGDKDNGRLATDRPHVLNAYGSYILDWFGNKTNSTEFSVFQTFQSGTPQTSTIGYITTVIYTKRGDLGRSDMLSQTDFSVSHKYKFGMDNRFTMALDLNILNFFDQKAVTSLQTSLSAVTMSPSTFGLNEVDGANAFTSGALLTQIQTYLEGTPTVLNRKNSSYGLPNGYQGARSVRFGFRFMF